MELVPSATTVLSRCQFLLPAAFFFFLLGLLLVVVLAAAAAVARATFDHCHCRETEKKYQNLLLPSGDWVRVPLQ